MRYILHVCLVEGRAGLANLSPTRAAYLPCQGGPIATARTLGANDFYWDSIRREKGEPFDAITLAADGQRTVFMEVRP